MMVCMMVLVLVLMCVCVCMCAGRLGHRPGIEAWARAWAVLHLRPQRHRERLLIDRIPHGGEARSRRHRWCGLLCRSLPLLQGTEPVVHCRTVGLNPGIHGLQQLHHITQCRSLI
jgi:hypothetical protein